MIPNSRFQHC
uniref:Uncharacterized protein n=1 Tax=Anguilla anguilla TaxID=7936 RepID=A0A0E9RPA5_ANGAN